MRLRQTSIWSAMWKFQVSWTKDLHEDCREVCRVQHLERRSPIPCVLRRLGGMCVGHKVCIMEGSVEEDSLLPTSFSVYVSMPSIDSKSLFFCNGSLTLFEALLLARYFLTSSVVPPTSSIPQKFIHTASRSVYCYSSGQRVSDLVPAISL